MKAAGLKQVQLAENLNITEGYLSNLINGRRQPSPALLQQIASALGVRVSDLLDEPAASGMSENEVQFLGAAPSIVRGLCRALDLDCLSPTLLKVNEPYPAFGLRNGDTLIADLNPPNPPLKGLVIATISDPDTGAGLTRICRVTGGMLLQDDYKADPIKAFSQDVAIMATVLGSFRKE